MVVVDTATRGEYSRIAILSLIRAGETRGCHTAAQVVLAVEVEVDWRSRTKSLSAADFRSLIGTGYQLTDRQQVHMADMQDQTCLQ